MEKIKKKPEKDGPCPKVSALSRTLCLEKGQILSSALAEAGHGVRADCAGTGTCGQCRVQVPPGASLSLPTDAERVLLTDLEMKTGVRLACQVRSSRSQTMAVCLPEEDLGQAGCRVTVSGGRHRRGRVGVAIDLGTTSVDLILCDLDDGTPLVSASGKNAQTCHGDDVVSRIAAAQNPEIGLAKLQGLAVRTINRLLSACLKAGKIKANAVARVALAGNTAMTLILAGIDPGSLGRYPYQPVITDLPVHTAGTLGLDLDPKVPVYLFPAVSGFIGGDTISALMAWNFDRDQTCLLVDIGTNGELVLCHRNRFFAVSCATGPAFEGARISCGMPAMEGAIDRMDMDPESGKFVWHVIGSQGGIKPAGLCGSGIVDAVAGLRRANLLSPSGLLDPGAFRVTKTDNTLWVELVAPIDTRHGRALVLSQKDIGEVQLAKAALCAGIELLLLRSGADHIDQTLLTGAFGAGFDYTKAVAMGMLPKVVLTGRVRVAPGLVVTGAVMGLVDPKIADRALALSRTIAVLELGGDPEFEDRFIAAMAFPEQIET
ncbi:MAG: DUF4445 domain-containing protein [Proteobacteria bacterium]|nr:DUF4445 domain-containing protein [Desulfobacula sp.]MBU4132313.1 DUF4445 domain-containing protein [Pseudomonadota bacterium]